MLLNDVYLSGCLSGWISVCCLSLDDTIKYTPEEILINRAGRHPNSSLNTDDCALGQEEVNWRMKKLAQVPKDG